MYVFLGVFVTVFGYVRGSARVLSPTTLSRMEFTVVKWDSSRDCSFANMSVVVYKTAANVCSLGDVDLIREADSLPSPTLLLVNGLPDCDIDKFAESFPGTFDMVLVNMFHNVSFLPLGAETCRYTKKKRSVCHGAIDIPDLTQEEIFSIKAIQVEFDGNPYHRTGFLIVYGMIGGVCAALSAYKIAYGGNLLKFHLEEKMKVTPAVKFIVLGLFSSLFSALAMFVLNDAWIRVLDEGRVQPITAKTHVKRLLLALLILPIALYIVFIFIGTAQAVTLIGGLTAFSAVSYYTAVGIAFYKTKSVALDLLETTGNTNKILMKKVQRLQKYLRITAVVMFIQNATLLTLSTAIVLRSGYASAFLNGIFNVVFQVQGFTQMKGIRHKSDV